jgi:hypothetical protein
VAFLQKAVSFVELLQVRNNVVVRYREPMAAAEVVAETLVVDGLMEFVGADGGQACAGLFEEVAVPGKKRCPAGGNEQPDPLLPAELQAPGKILIIMLERRLHESVVSSGKADKLTAGVAAEEAKAPLGIPLPDQVEDIVGI